MKKNNVLKTVAILVPIVFLFCSAFETDQNMLEEPVEVSLETWVGRFVTVNAVAGNDTLKLLLDTGGGETFISPDAAHRLGCTPSGRSVGFRMTGERVEFQYCPNITLSIGGVAFHHHMIGVWDINSILPEDLPPLDGILSLKTFAQQPFTLDLSSKRLILETQQSLDERSENMTRLNSRIATGPDGSELTLFLHGKIEESGWFLLDSGNMDAILVAPHLLTSKAGDSTATTNVWKSEFKLDNSVATIEKIRTKDIIYDGALSEEFMRKRVLTFDLSNNAVWVSLVGK